jgi:XisH protein
MARDKFHKNVREALENDGWTITDDPYFLMVGRRHGFIDLGAERLLIAAEKGTERIAVEIKSFVGGSDLSHFEDALGQFLVYLVALESKDPERVLYLALPQTFYERFFDDPFFQKLAKRFAVNFLVYNEINNTVISWIT